MHSYKDLLAQRDALNKQISEVLEAARAEAVQNCRQQVAEFKITAAELGLAAGRVGKAARQQRPAVAVKYRDPATGATWSGRGKPPRWIAGQDRERFAV